MLILTRKSGETIRIGDAIAVRVLEIRGNQVRLGVDAPADVRIWREEVLQAMQRQDRRANGVDPLAAPPPLPRPKD